MSTDTPPPAPASPIPADETETERARRLAGAPIDPRTAYVPQFCQVAKAMRSMAHTVEEVAAACGVTVRTLRTWQVRYPEFDVAMQLGKERLVANLVDSLYRRALGYEIEEERAFVVDKKMRRIGITTHVPANAACLFFALENLDPANWHNPLKMDPAAKPAEVTDQPMTTDEWDEKFGRRGSAVN
jgi:hypothetical protein